MYVIINFLYMEYDISSNIIIVSKFTNKMR